MDRLRSATHTPTSVPVFHFLSTCRNGGVAGTDSVILGLDESCGKKINFRCTADYSASANW